MVRRKSGELVIWHVEIGVGHGQWLEDPVPKEGAEALARYHFDQPAQDIDARAVVPLGSRMGLER